jgi:hypothetical protein
VVVGQSLDGEAVGGILHVFFKPHDFVTLVPPNLCEIYM